MGEILPGDSNIYINTERAPLGSNSGDSGTIFEIPNVNNNAKIHFYILYLKYRLIYLYRMFDGLVLTETRVVAWGTRSSTSSISDSRELQTEIVTSRIYKGDISGLYSKTSPYKSRLIQKRCEVHPLYFVDKTTILASDGSTLLFNKGKQLHMFIIYIKESLQDQFIFL